MAAILLPTFVALCLGALVGLERQVAQEESDGQKDFPGARTFAFMALLGALAVLLKDLLEAWMSVALFVAAATFVVLRYQYDSSKRDDPGYTTEIASLCTFATGALAQSGQLLVATAITITMVALLRSKRALHRAGALLSPDDMEALIRFLAIVGVVWPLLPDQTYDPWGVLSPADVWRMVVLVSALSFVGYVLIRRQAGGRHHLLSGLLGGLVSSTATALAYARLGRQHEGAQVFGAAVVLASCSALLRVSIALAVVAPQLLPPLLAPFSAMVAVGVFLGLLFHQPGGGGPAAPAYENPLNLRVALAFAAIYALVLLAAAAARERFADPGLYGVAALSALAGADAPTLTLARLAVRESIGEVVAARGIALVAVVTTLGKAGIMLFVAGGEVGGRAAATLTAMAATGAVVLYLLL